MFLMFLCLRWTMLLTFLCPRWAMFLTLLCQKLKCRLCTVLLCQLCAALLSQLLHPGRPPDLLRLTFQSSSRPADPLHQSLWASQPTFRPSTPVHPASCSSFRRTSRPSTPARPASWTSSQSSSRPTLQSFLLAFDPLHPPCLDSVFYPSRKKQKGKT